MRDTPKKRRTGRTPEEIEQGGRLIDALCVLFRPFVLAACRPKIEAEMAKPLQFDAEAIKNMDENIKGRDDLEKKAGEIWDAARKKMDLKFKSEYGHVRDTLVVAQDKDAIKAVFAKAADSARTADDAPDAVRRKRIENQIARVIQGYFAKQQKRIIQEAQRARAASGV